MLRNLVNADQELRTGNLVFKLEDCRSDVGNRPSGQIEGTAGFHQTSTSVQILNLTLKVLTEIPQTGALVKLRLAALAAICNTESLWGRSSSVPAS
ncbi:MAG: hypothetical protein WBD96_03220, partial [Pseudolabrys sp.]